MREEPAFAPSSEGATPPNAATFSTADQNVLFTSDTHFWHENIIRFCNRPFASVEEMNQALVRNWNAAVRDNDVVFHLGDFGMAASGRMNDLYHALRGRIFLVLGNHDRRALRHPSSTWRFEAVAQQMTVSVDGVKILLNHLPFLCFPGAYRRDEWQLFGHVHSGPLHPVSIDSARLDMLFPTQYDVGVDNNSFAPVSFAALRDIIQRRVAGAKRHKAGPAVGH